MVLKIAIDKVSNAANFALMSNFQIMCHDLGCMFYCTHRKTWPAKSTKLEPRSSVLVKPNHPGHLYNSEQSQTGWKRIILLINFCEPHQNLICCNKWHWYSVEYLCYLERTTVRIKVPWCFLPSWETLLVEIFKSCLIYSQAV